MKNKLVVPPSGEREGVGDKPAAISTAQSCLTLCNPEDYGQPGSSVYGVLQARILDWVAISFCSGSSPPRIKPESGGGFFTPEPPRKPKNAGAGSLSLLQGIFLTQESDWGPLHCRQFLYQLNYQGSPRVLKWVENPFSRGSS